LLLAAAVLVPGAGHAAGTNLIGTVGPGPTISLADANGVTVSHLDPGTYTILVHDRSPDHNFHLFGAGGVDQSTDVTGTGDTTWTVTFVNGKYDYLCDVHPATMHKKFTAGVVPVTPKLTGSVGPGKTITLKNASGKKATTVAPGTWKITIADKTKRDNFHLSGPGVNKKTGVKFRGTVSWTVKLRAGSKYRYFSDAHKKIAGSFAVSKLPLPTS
jgi:plastocyanin